MSTNHSMCEFHNFLYGKLFIRSFFSAFLKENKNMKEGLRISIIR